MRDFFEYFIGLLKDWKSDVVGGIVALAAWLWHPIFRKSMPDNILLPAIGLCFFAASFRAWQREHRHIACQKPSKLAIEKLEALRERVGELEPRVRKKLRELLVKRGGFREASPNDPLGDRHTLSILEDKGFLNRDFANAFCTVKPDISEDYTQYSSRMIKSRYFPAAKSPPAIHPVRKHDP
jgi:hypothetical protein